MQNRQTGVLILTAALCSCLHAADGVWTGAGASPTQYWDADNWLDGTVASGAGSSAYFTNAVASTVALTNDLTLGYLQIYSPTSASDIVFTGSGITLDGSAPTIRNDNRRLVSRAVFYGTNGFTKTGNNAFYPYRKMQMTGPITFSQGTLGADFRQDADSTNALACNMIPTNSLAFSSYGGQLRIGGRPNRTSDQTGVFTLSADTLKAVRVSGVYVGNLSAGQLVTADAGVLAGGTYLKTVLDDNTFELSAAPLVPGNATLTFKKASFDTFQEFGRVQTYVTGSFYVGNAGGDSTTLRFGELAGGYGLYLDGSDSTVEIQNTRDFGGVITLTNTVDLALTDQRSIPSGPATNAAFHVDMSAAGTLTTSVSGGNTYLTKWLDKNGTLTSSASDTRFAVSTGNRTGLLPPFVMTNALNGLPVVDFGAAGSERAMIWNDNITGIRTVFMVVGSQAGGGTLLGSKDSNVCSFERGMDVFASKGTTVSKTFTTPLTRNHALLWNPGSNNRAWLNGQQVDYQYSGLSGDYDLFSFVWDQDTSGGSASAFAWRGYNTTSNYIDRSGGQRLAEVILYQRALTDQERQDTEAYLYWKWFGKALAGYGAPKINTLRAFGSGNAISQLGTNAVEIDALNLRAGNALTVGTGTVVTVKNATLDGSVTLAGGTLEFGARSVPLAPAPQTALHLDAGTNVTVDGSTVTRWDDCAGSNRYAFSYSGFAPSLVQNALNGMPVIDFGALGSQQFLAWDTNVVVRSLFLVVKVLGNNAAPLGSYQPMMGVVSHFTRQNSQIWSPNGQVTVRSGACYLDGERVNPGVFTMTVNSFVVLGQVMEGSSIANAFACEAYLYTDPSNRANRTGGLQLAEVLIYDRKLTERESLDTQAYLNWKWFGRVFPGYAAPGGTYSVPGITATADSSLVVEGDTSVVLNSLSGAGDIRLQSSTPVSLGTTSGWTGGLTLTNALMRFTASQTLPSLAVFGATTVTTADGVTVTANELTGDGTLTTAGNGTLALDTVSGFGGDLALTGGTLSVTAEKTLSVGTLSVTGSGAFQLDFGTAPYAAGTYELIAFDNMDAQSQADLLANWSLANVPPKFGASLVIRDNTVIANLSALGTLFKLQ